MWIPSCLWPPDQLFNLSGLLRASWEFAHPVCVCSVDSQKAWDRVPRGVPQGHCGNIGFCGCCNEPFDPYVTKVRDVLAFSTQPGWLSVGVP